MTSKKSEIQNTKPKLSIKIKLFLGIGAVLLPGIVIAFLLLDLTWFTIFLSTLSFSFFYLLTGPFLFYKTLNAESKSYFKKIIASNNTFFALGKYWLILFGFIAFTFGILSSFCLNYEELNQKFDFPNYDWLDPVSIVDFACDQYERSDADYVYENEISLKEPDSCNYFIIIDATEDILDKEDGYIQKLSSTIQKKIVDVVPITETNMNFNSWDLRDLIAFYYVFQLHQSKKTAGSRVCVKYYFGDGTKENSRNFGDAFSGEIPTRGDKEGWKKLASDFVGFRDENSKESNSYCNGIKNRATKNTNFSTIIDEVVKNCKEISIPSHVMVLSDFAHDNARITKNRYSFSDLNSKLNRLSKVKSIKQLTFIRFPEANENKTLSNKIIQLFHNYLDKKIYQHTISDSKYTDRKDDLEQDTYHLFRILATVVKPNNICIYFSKKWDLSSRDYIYHGKIIVKNYDEKEITLRLRDNSGSETLSNSYIQENQDNTKINVGSFGKTLTLERDTSIHLQFYEKDMDFLRYSIEIGRSSENGTQYFTSIPIVKVENISQSASVALIFLYSHVIIVSILILSYGLLKLLFLFRDKDYPRWRVFSGAQFLLLLVICICLFLKFWEVSRIFCITLTDFKYTLPFMLSWLFVIATFVVLFKYEQNRLQEELTIKRE